MTSSNIDLMEEDPMDIYLQDVPTIHQYENAIINDGENHNYFECNEMSLFN